MTFLNVDLKVICLPKFLPSHLRVVVGISVSLLYSANFTWRLKYFYCIVLYCTTVWVATNCSRAHSYLAEINGHIRFNMYILVHDKATRTSNSRSSKYWSHCSGTTSLKPVMNALVCSRTPRLKNHWVIKLVITTTKTHYHETLHGVTLSQKLFSAILTTRHSHFTSPKMPDCLPLPW